MIYWLDNYMNTEETIKSIIEGDVDVSPSTIKKCSTDASIFEVTPTAVIYPKNITDLSALVRFVSEKREKGGLLSLTPRAGGTCMSGGPLTESYVVDLTRYFNNIDNVDTSAQAVWVESGVMYVDIEKATHHLDLFFPPYTSSRDICGIGGMIGNNASGEKSVKYGATSSNITRLKVLLSDGNEYEFGPLTFIELEEKKALPTFEGELYREVTKLIYENWNVIDKNHPRVKKNTAGYPLWDLWSDDQSIFNMARLFIGSQASLGIVTKAELNLVHFPKATRMIVAPISGLSDLTPVVKTLLHYNPDVCETFDHHTYELAKKYHPIEAEKANIAEGKHMVVFGIYAGDTQHLADVQAGQAKEELERMGKEVFWVEDPSAVESFLLIRRKSFRMLLEHPHPNKRAMAFLEDTIVPLEHYGEFLGALEAILAEYDMTYTYAGHIGDGSIRLVPLVNMELPGAQEMVMEVERRVNNLVFAFGGSMSVDHNDGIIRTSFLEQMYGKEMVGFFAEIKKIFDPLNIFNPGKKVGGTFEYAIDHMVRKNH